MPDNENPTVRTHRILEVGRIGCQRKKILEIEKECHRKTGFTRFDYLHEDFDQEIASDDEDSEEKIDPDEIFDLIRSITDPEHPLTLEDLSVVSSDQISVTYPTDSEDSPHVLVRFTPTIPHCSMATLIGLTLRVRLLRSLPERFKVDIKIKEGTHQSENSVNKQLNDKERVAAALENTHLSSVVQQCLQTAHLRGLKVRNE
ncbi:hypothetical protein O181_056684 [Austropuccinia psidii MF-1]|uniref:MIP18 family-like domain-containing protein n=1 Tax=Austropuccinia psidii MF-1 TaxID=1389203 RepID=A0A9Q3HVW9_9BASI|nr:hypothetical protein [Austropuccinia psidii MF-1]